MINSVPYCHKFFPQNPSISEQSACFLSAFTNLMKPLLKINEDNISQDFWKYPRQNIQHLSCKCAIPGELESLVGEKTQCILQARKEEEVQEISQA